MLGASDAARYLAVELEILKLRQADHVFDLRKESRHPHGLSVAQGLKMEMKLHEYRLQYATKD